MEARAIQTRAPVSDTEQILHGDCVQVMQTMPTHSIDLIVTDPPYGVRYRDRTGRQVANDHGLEWVVPAYQEMYRLLKQNSICISFYGWNRIEVFMNAWKRAGFTPVSHIVWRKGYSSKVGFVKASHEQAYVLAKGRPPMPRNPLWDVQRWHYTGNEHHPTQKSVEIIRPLIESFSRPGDVVLDPFAGSGSTPLAADVCGRHGLGIELDATHCDVARTRLAHLHARQGKQRRPADQPSTVIQLRR
ncbi:MAG: DNA methyltransferase [Pseudomonadota bacterium]